MAFEAISALLSGVRRRRAERLFGAESAALSLLSGRYRASTGRDPDLRSPKLLSERLLWMRLYARDPLCPVLAERSQQREYARAKGCDRALPRLFGAYAAPKSVPWRALPERASLWASHLCGERFDIRSRADAKAARAAASRWMRRSQYAETGEWEYRGIPPGLSLEAFCGEGEFFRVLCVGGQPEAIYRAGEPGTLFDGSGRLLCGRENPLPESVGDMLDLSRTLSEGFAFLRLEFLNAGAGARFIGLRFGEDIRVFTLWPGDIDGELGSRLRLPERSR